MGGVLTDAARQKGQEAAALLCVAQVADEGEAPAVDVQRAAVEEHRRVGAGIGQLDVTGADHDARSGVDDVGGGGDGERLEAIGRIDALEVADDLIEGMQGERQDAEAAFERVEDRRWGGIADDKERIEPEGGETVVEGQVVGAHAAHGVACQEHGVLVVLEAPDRRAEGVHDVPGGFWIGSGEWIRTTDLRVMSPTSYHCSTPR